MAQPIITAPSRHTVVDQLTAALIDAVATGRFTVGEALPPERDLADELGVNRTTLRQAVGRLEQIGLVRRRQGSGTLVQDPGGLTAPEIVGRMASAERREFVADLLEVREALAGVIGARASSSITKEQTAVLRDVIEGIRTSDNAAERQILELAFFAVLVDAAGNRAISVLLRWVEQVYAHLPATPSLQGVSDAFADTASIVDELGTLLEVIERGEDLALAMTSYARLSGARLLQTVGDL